MFADWLAVKRSESFLIFEEQSFKRPHIGTQEILYSPRVGVTTYGSSSGAILWFRWSLR